jgi:feruloyl esterase
MRHLLVSLSLIAAAAPAASATKTECSLDALQQQAPKGTTILAASIIAAKEKIPEHCFVEGNVATPGNVVDFHLALPTNWNGKFLFQGVGGFAGSFARLDNSLERGYAAATTDSGHKGASGTDGKWALNHRPKEIDYGHRGAHVTTVAAQKLTAAYFGSKPKYRYFNGCSNGGRMALMEAQRYPDDYDGIVAGDPSFGAGGYVRRGLMYQFMLASPDRVLPAEKLALVSKAALDVCDATDGVIDGLIGDPRQCKFEPSTLLCKAAESSECLTAAQLETVKMIYSDVQLPNGTTLRGFPVGHEGGATGWPLWISGRQAPTKQADGRLWFTEEASPTGFRFADGFFRYMAFEQDDPNYDWRTFDVNRDLSKIETISTILSPTNADLKKFGASGKKLLLYHGWADPAISAYGTIDYYNKVVANVGDKKKADNFVRLFLAPGMHHCAGGPGPNSFDAIAAMEQWVEKGVAPDKLIASRSVEGKVQRTRPLCPEPQVAKYVGTGSIDVAENFRCEMPAR